MDRIHWEAPVLDDEEIDPMELLEMIFSAMRNVTVMSLATWAYISITSGQRPLIPSLILVLLAGFAFIFKFIIANILLSFDLRVEARLEQIKNKMRISFVGLLTISAAVALIALDQA